MRLPLLLLGSVFGLAAAAVSQTAVQTAHPAGPAQTPPNFKVAFVGDQGINSDAEAVLRLIADEGADMVLHQGDLGYGNETDPQSAVYWDEQITSILGDDFPYFASVGNHDVGNWPTYQSLLAARLGRVTGASCTGDYGVMAACTYQGLLFLLSGAGTSPNIPDHAPHIDYIQDQLAQDDSLWRICTWHKNQNAMQMGSKTDEVGWEPYEECRRGRAIIATGHEHSYSRTKTLSNTQTQTVDPLWPNPNELRVSAGSTFVFVSGLGGKSIRNQDRCLPATPPYGCSGEWAGIYASDQGASYGALFIEFHINGDPREAGGYFKNVDGETIDSFTIVSDHDASKPATATPTPTPTKQPPPGDTDSDGCEDLRENGPDPRHGGRRDYLSFWDFYDVWAHPVGDPSAWERNGSVNLFGDIFGVANRFGGTGDPNGDPLEPPTADTGYHTAFDRGPLVGPGPWDLGPADGVIDLFIDVLGVANQFGHDCMAAS